MNRRFSLRRRRAVALALSACVLTVAAPTAVAATWEDMHPQAARDAAAASQQQAQPAPAETRTVITVEERGSQTLAIVFSASALGLALLAVGFTAVARRPRPRWTAP
jgi:hypothetical protein